MSDERIYVITGANKGIGLEICRQIARQQPQAVVLLTARSELRGRDAYKALQSEGLSNIVFQQLDVTDVNSVESAKAIVEVRYGKLDVLVHNAAYAARGPQLDEQVAHKTLNVNYFGVKRVGETFLPLMHAGSRMVIVSSGMGDLVSEYSEDKRRTLSSPNLNVDELSSLMQAFISAAAQDRVTKEGWRTNAYAVSKAGVNALTRIWARDLESRGIMVNACSPGWVRTDMGGPNATLDVSEGAETPVWLATEPEEEIGASGGYYSEKRRVE
jgi:carbonyl reductase 1